jgi:hypothetical protein
MPLAAPFIIAFLLAAGLNGQVRLLNRRLRLKRGIAAVNGSASRIGNNNDARKNKNRTAQSMHIRHTALSFRPGLPNRRNRSGQKPVRPHPKPGRRAGFTG